MPYLRKVTITFNTHGDDKNDDTILHVFVKNRSNTSSTPEQATDYISNLLAYQSYEAAGAWDTNPYLAFGENLAVGPSFDDPSSATFEIPLRATPIPLEEVILPVVNIHILPNVSDQWIFDYTITFLFDDGRSFPASSNTNGVTGIILDQDNRNYSGICVENPFITLPPLSKPQTDAVLQRVTLEFYTHDTDDANKNDDTQLNVHIVNRLSASSSQDIAIGLDLLKGEEFAAKSTNSIVFSQNALASNSIRLRDMVLPVVFINIAPSADDQWIFDYRVTYTFSNGQKFSSQTNGIILDQDNRKYAGVYQGSPFPTVTPPGKPQLNVHDHRIKSKFISLRFLQKKLDEFINKRQGLGSQDPPIFKIRLHNMGTFGGTFPESYYDLQSLVANPPPPGVLSPPGFKEAVKYNSSPTSLGQLTHSVTVGSIDLYLNNINSMRLTAKVDTTRPAPLTVKVDFDCTGPQEVVSETIGGIGGMNFKNFSVRISLTLTLDKDNSMIDVMSWVPDLDWKRWTFEPQLNGENLSIKASGQFLGQMKTGWIAVHSGTTTTMNSDLFMGSDFVKGLIGQVIDVELDLWDSSVALGSFKDEVRDRIFKKLTDPQPFDRKTLRDRLNSNITSWLLGGVIEGDSRCRVTDVAINGDNLEITYTGPESTFVPPVPADWPSGTAFSPGNLANIDHIVVLTMENRSFDQMLGYLSLPPERGGMGRKDVDGLKGTEFNLLDGTACPSFAFHVGDTVFALDPPHGYEPVHKAINGGKMDGFAQSYADEHGPAAAYRIMGYHTAINVPTYDALARDFAIGHRWFASHPGPTFCNRFYELTGRLNIDRNGFWEVNNSSPLLPVFTPTIFDYLSAQRVSWKYFEHHYCFLRFFQSHTFDTENIVAFDDPVFGFVNLAKNGGLPSVSFIDPHFIELPPGGNCDGPPADVQAGQQLVQQVVEAVVTSPQWTKTLLIITYDEHGGFYDHVPPPAATRVSPESLGTYGVRVPAFVISPWVKGGTVFGHDGVVVGGGQGGIDVGTTAHGLVTGQLHNLHFDHTSILKTIARRFMSQNPPYMGARYAEANDLSSVIGNELRPSQFLPFISYNFVYGASQKRLDVQGAGVTPGTILWQYNPNDTIAQQFSFEDAGDGYYYIRTHTGSLYVTADDSLGLKQDVKYPTDGSATAANNPDQQRWKLTSTVLDKTSFTIWNAAFPGKVLQPSGGSNDSGIPVVLGDRQATHIGVEHTPNPWQVTSPLLSSGEVVHH
jgi:hypothetical protein